MVQISKFVFLDQNLNWIKWHYLQVDSLGQGHAEEIRTEVAAYFGQ